MQNINNQQSNTGNVIDFILLKRVLEFAHPYKLYFFVAAISAGIISNKACVDLDYVEDSAAEVDANFVICDNGKISEIQATGEEYFFSEEQYQDMFKLAKTGIEKIIANQKNVLNLN